MYLHVMVNILSTFSCKPIAQLKKKIMIEVNREFGKFQFLQCKSKTLFLCTKYGQNKKSSSLKVILTLNTASKPLRFKTYMRKHLLFHNKCCTTFFQGKLLQFTEI